jgi:hypothetical protein
LRGRLLLSSPCTLPLKRRRGAAIASLSRMKHVIAAPTPV